MSLYYFRCFRPGFWGAWLLCLSIPVLAAPVEISGIKDDSILSNVSAHIDSVEPPAAKYQYEQYGKQLADKVRQAVEVFGYYHCEVQVSPPADNEKNDKWHIQASLGNVTRIDAINLTIEGDGRQEPALQEWLNKLAQMKDQALRHAAYESAKSQLQNNALSLGYFDFRFTEHVIKVVESSYTASITLNMNTGKRYAFGEIRFPEDDRARELVLESLPFQVGESYEADKLTTLNRNLKQTQYFRQVLIRPLVAEAVDYQVPIEIILTHKPKDNFDLGAGVSSDIGPRFTAKWLRPWVNDYGHSLGAELYLSEPERSISFDYRVPIEDPVKNYASFQIGFLSSDDNDTRSDNFTLSATRHWTVEGSDWQRAAFVRLEQETFTQGLEDKQTTRLVTPGLTLSRLRTKGGLDIDWGDKQSLTIEAASDVLLSDINLFRVTAQTKWLRSWGLHRVLWRADLGGTATEDFDQVPSSLRYFAGGDQSIRGFGYRTLSPYDYDEDGEKELTGGRYLAVGSVEYSYPFAQNWRMALFIDAGTSTNKFPGDIATGIGAGVNWLTLVGPVRIYLARGNSDFENQWRIHFSMGPAL